MFKHATACLLTTSFLTACISSPPSTVESTTSDEKEKIATTANTEAASVNGLVIPAASASTNDRSKEAVKNALSAEAAAEYMDKQEVTLRKALLNSGIDIIRAGNEITLIIPSEQTFEPSKATIKPQAEPLFDTLGQILQKFTQTAILIVGHTDSTNREELNQSLSEQWATSVKLALTSRKIALARIHTSGLGSSSPIASNAIAPGRQTNRRIELTLLPIPPVDIEQHRQQSD